MNDERPIETLLHRAAQKRQEEAGAPPELHSSNRRMLQQEVARQFPSPPAPRPTFWEEIWAGLRRRRMYAVAAVPILVLVAFVFLPSWLNPKAPKQRLAMQSPTPAEEAATVSAVSDLASVAPANIPGSEAVVIAPTSRTGGRDPNQSLFATSETVASRTAAAAAGSETRVDRLVRSVRPAETSMTVAASPAYPSSAAAPIMLNGGAKPLPAGPTDRIEGDSAAVRANEFGLAGAREIPPARDATTDTAAPPGISQDLSLARAESGPAGSGGAEVETKPLNSQAYSNVSWEELQNRAREKRAVAPLVPILANFTIEQKGRDMRVVDEDGSIYTGVVDERNTLYQQVVEKKKQELTASYDNVAKFQSPKLGAAVPTGATSESDYYLYRVEGTNRTLRQNVVFYWNFVPTNKSIAEAQYDYRRALLESKPGELPSQLPALLQNSYLNGRAEFGDRKQIDVNAVPVP